MSETELETSLDNVINRTSWERSPSEVDSSIRSFMGSRAALLEQLDDFELDELAA